MADFPIDIIEVLHPIQQGPKSNIAVFRTDNLMPKSIQKSASVWVDEFTAIGMRIRESNMSAFITFMRANLGTLITLDVDGIYPFLNALTDNDVYLHGYTKPTRNRQLQWQTSVVFRLQ